MNTMKLKACKICNFHSIVLVLWDARIERIVEELQNKLNP